MPESTSRQSTANTSLICVFWKVGQRSFMGIFEQILQEKKKKVTGSLCSGVDGCFARVFRKFDGKAMYRIGPQVTNNQTRE